MKRLPIVFWQLNFRWGFPLLTYYFFEKGCSHLKIISQNDVALYGGLCSLATLSREDVKSKVIESVNFRQYLELDPVLREIITSFCECRYSECLDLLNTAKVSELTKPLTSEQSHWLLDLYLRAHVSTLFKLIRTRLLIQYLLPFLSVDINKMASVFKCDPIEMEAELVELIESHQIQGRIDSIKKV